MDFNYQLNNLFNQRRAGLSEEERVNLDQRHRKLQRRHNRLQEFGQHYNIAFEVTVTDGYEFHGDGAHPVRFELACGNFHIAINNIFNARRVHQPNREGDPINWVEIELRGHELHNALVQRGDGGDRVSITVVAFDMNNDNMPLPFADDNMNEDAAEPFYFNEGPLLPPFPPHGQPADPLLEIDDDDAPIEADNAAQHVADDMPIHWQPAEPLPIEIGRDDALIQLGERDRALAGYPLP